MKRQDHGREADRLAFYLGSVVRQAFRLVVSILGLALSVVGKCLAFACALTTKPHKTLSAMELRAEAARISARASASVQNCCDRLERLRGTAEGVEIWSRGRDRHLEEIEAGAERIRAISEELRSLNAADDSLEAVEADQCLAAHACLRCLALNLSRRAAGLPLRCDLLKPASTEGSRVFLSHDFSLLLDDQGGGNERKPS